jgi:lysozyme family protein
VKQNRDIIIDLVFGHEKGFVNRPKTDRGGPTNMGITQRTLSAWRGKPVTIQDVKELTRAEAFEIYAKEYWIPIRGDDLPSGLDYAVFDSCVTSGPDRSVRILQGVLIKAGADIGIDGNIGAQTLDAIKKYPNGIVALIRDYCEARVAWMKTLSGPKGFKSNGRGWTIRVTGVDPKGEWKTQPGVVGTAVKMAAGQQAVPIPVVYDEVKEQATTKTSVESTSLPTIAAKPEAVATIVSVLTAIFAAVQGNAILSYALACVIVVAAAVAGYYFVKRIRATGV